ncbi:cytochrome P450 [Choiromyces venosus 120613-1]|uniref:Cytochrome P450 n=1 Tax=Choiromyces venosus 120613-1 TaxID=1336337 RepID=A0A3N4KIW9_9PEZI|nr:cytochrome P450 [Choiromyces venosus 120613-1]
MAISSLIPVIASVLTILRQNLVLILLVTGASAIIRRKYFHPLSKFPGPCKSLLSYLHGHTLLIAPVFAGITTLWRAYIMLTRRMHLLDMDLHRKYGPVFRDGPNSLSFSEPAAIEQIYGYRPRGEFEKSDWVLIFSENGKGVDYNTFSALYNEQHTKMRKWVAGTYSMSRILDYESRFNENISRWIGRLAGFNGEPIEFFSWLHYLTLDIISDIVYGNPLGFVEKGFDIHNYRKDLHAAFGVITVAGYLPSLVALTKTRLLRPLLAPSPKDKSGYGRLIGIAQSVVQERIRKGNTLNKPHLADDFINARREGGQNPPREDQVLAEVRSTIDAGSDSTAAAITGAINFLLRNQHAYDKLVAEIKDFSASGQLSSPVTYHETTKMEYLNAVIKESLRLFPPFQGAFTRLVPESGAEVMPGVFVPGGVEVGVNCYVSNRNKDVFGEDAEEFLPERWLTIDNPETRRKEKYINTFGYGSRICLGKNIAMIEIGKCLVELLRNFHISLVNPDIPMKEVNVLQMLVEDFFLTMRERENKF